MGSHSGNQQRYHSHADAICVGVLSLCHANCTRSSGDVKMIKESLTSVDDLVPLQVADAVEDSTTYFTRMNVPVGGVRGLIYLSFI